MRSRALAAALAMASLSLLGAAPPTPTPQAASEILAQSGDASLTVADLNALIAHADPAVRERLRKDPAALRELARTRVLQLRLLNLAHARQWDQDPDVLYRAKQAYEAAITDSFLASVTQPDPGYPSADEIQAAYEANKSRVVVPRQYHLAQIFLAVPADAAKPADEEAQKKLRDLRQSLGRPKADFAAQAKLLSQDRQSAAQGGDLGWLREDQLAPAIREAVAGLQEGALSDPIRLPDGWHLLKLIGTRPPAIPPLADVRDSLARALRQQKAQQNARAYLDQLQRDQPIELNEIALSHALAK